MDKQIFIEYYLSTYETKYKKDGDLDDMISIFKSADCCWINYGDKVLILEIGGKYYMLDITKPLSDFISIYRDQKINQLLYGTN